MDLLDDRSYICAFKFKNMMVPSVKHQEKVDYLLDKGLDILWSRGYNGTSVNDIVCAAKVPKGSFYFYFESKEDFVVQALRRYFALKRKVTMEVLTEPGSGPLERLYRYYAYRVALLKEKMNCTMGCMGSNIGVEMAEHSEKIRETIIAEEDKIRETIIAVVEEAREKNELNKDVDPTKLVNFMEDAFKGMLASMKATMCPQPLDNFLHFLKTIILK